MKNIRPIRSEDDLNWALAEIEAYFDDEPDPESEDGKRFDVLAQLIEAYEDKHWSIEAPDPIETIRFYLESNDLKQSHLAEIIGSRPRASEVMNYKRGLTLDMIQRICRHTKIPAEPLIQPYHLVTTHKRQTPRKAG